MNDINRSVELWIEFCVHWEVEALNGPATREVFRASATVYGRIQSLVRDLKIRRSGYWSRHIARDTRQVGVP